MPAVGVYQRIPSHWFKARQDLAWIALAVQGGRWRTLRPGASPLRSGEADTLAAALLKKWRAQHRISLLDKLPLLNRGHTGHGPAPARGGRAMVALDGKVWRHELEAHVGPRGSELAVR